VALARSTGARFSNIVGSLPISNDVIGLAGAAGWIFAQGFQKLPPMTSAISTLYDWNRSSTVVSSDNAEGVIVKAVACPLVAAPSAVTAMLGISLKFRGWLSVAGRFRFASAYRPTDHSLGPATVRR
jgi:hypothetical protein